MDFPYLTEFLTIAIVHFFAVASPGPDFAIVVKQSLVHGKKTALWTSLGVGIGILVHVTYSLFGIGLIISQSIIAFTILKILGAGYLIYIGLKSVQEKPPKDIDLVDYDQKGSPSALASFKIGFLTNALNPKATLFFLSLFSVIISPKTPMEVQFIYGIWMCIATALWFSLLSLFFSSQKVRNYFKRFGHWISRVMGGALIALGVKLAFTTAH